MWGSFWIGLAFQDVCKVSTEAPSLGSLPLSQGFHPACPIHWCSVARTLCSVPPRGRIAAWSRFMVAAKVGCGISYRTCRQSTQRSKQLMPRFYLSLQLRHLQEKALRGEGWTVSNLLTRAKSEERWLPGRLCNNPVLGQILVKNTVHVLVEFDSCQECLARFRFYTRVCEG